MSLWKISRYWNISIELWIGLWTIFASDNNNDCALFVRIYSTSSMLGRVLRITATRHLAGCLHVSFNLLPIRMVCIAVMQSAYDYLSHNSAVFCQAQWTIRDRIGCSWATPLAWTARAEPKESKRKFVDDSVKAPHKTMLIMLCTFLQKSIDSSE